MAAHLRLSRVAVDGQRLPAPLARRVGSGVMRVVLLHPLPLDGRVWAASMRTWAGSVVVPSLYALGESMEAWASEVLQSAGPGPLVLVGCSVGGSCAIEVARLAPERVRLLVLVGAKAGHRTEPKLRDEAVRVLSEEGMTGAWLRYWAPLFGPHTDPDVVERARGIAFEQKVDDVIRGVRVFHGRPDRRAFLEALDVPVCVVSGELDRTPAGSAALAASLRRGSFHRVAGAGHYVPLERPAELTAIVGRAMEARL